MSTLTMKFGGGSLGTARSLAAALNIIRRESGRWDRLVIVVSALEGVTDMLLEAAQLARVSDRRGYRRIAATLRTRHLALVERLPFDEPAESDLKAAIDVLLSDMLDHCLKVANSLDDELLPAMTDAVVAVGERLSARIIAALLRQHRISALAVDGVDLLVTDAVHGNANPILGETAKRVDATLIPMLERSIVPVVTGYIGATGDGTTTTLGRGGTDYTASVLSALLRADELWIWTDVDGMMSADPREVPDAHVVPRLDYSEAGELAYFGARILHAKMMGPLAENGLPLRIRNIFLPEAAGTLISGAVADGETGIKAVTSIQGLSLRRASSGSLAGITKLVGNTLFKTLGMRSEVMIASQSSTSSFLCLVIPTSIGIDGVDRLQRALIDKMAQYPQKMPWEINTVALVTAIGAGINARPQLLSAVLGALDDIEVYGLALGPAQCGLTVALSQSDAKDAVQRIHALTLKSD